MNFKLWMRASQKLFHFRKVDNVTGIWLVKMKPRRSLRTAKNRRVIHDSITFTSMRISATALRSQRFKNESKIFPLNGWVQ
jgi:hypothetical protein